MARDERDKRLEQAVDDGREWVERTAADVADRLGRAWASVRSRGEGGKPKEGSDEPPPLFDEADANPAELFSHDRQREVERLGHANILIIDMRGAGKGPLINAAFRKPLARAETGRPVTKVIQRFE